MLQVATEAHCAFAGTSVELLLVPPVDVPVVVRLPPKLDEPPRLGAPPMLAVPPRARGGLPGLAEPPSAALPPSGCGTLPLVVDVEMKPVPPLLDVEAVAVDPPLAVPLREPPLLVVPATVAVIPPEAAVVPPLEDSWLSLELQPTNTAIAIEARKPLRPSMREPPRLTGNGQNTCGWVVGRGAKRQLTNCCKIVRRDAAPPQQR
jgi:hypothetical protein